MLMVVNSWERGAWSLVPMWRAEENLMKLFLSYSHVGLGDQILVVRPGHRHIYPLSHVRLSSRHPYLLSYLTEPAMLE